MLISHTHKFIFIHIYKTGGTSISHALMPYCTPRFRIYAHKILSLFRFYSLNPIPYPKHISAGKLVDSIGEEMFNSYFTFSIVRNPWDWQASLYHYMLAHPEHPEHKNISSLGSFSNYIEWRYQRGIVNQAELLQVGDRINLDFIGRFENLDHDFNRICLKLGIQERLPHKNLIPKKPYQHYYTSETRAMIHEICKLDIDTFGYKFDH